MKQRFKRGDLVRVGKMGGSMIHFQGDCNAIVIGSYAETYGGSDTKSYTLFLEGSGECSWYLEHQLIFVRHAPELLETWKDQAEAAHLQRTNLRWILDNWESIIKRPAYDTMLRVMELLEVPTSFHRNGEYFALASDWFNYFPTIDFIIGKRALPDGSEHLPESVKLLALRDRCWLQIDKQLQAK